MLRLTSPRLLSRIPIHLIFTNSRLTANDLIDTLTILLVHSGLTRTAFSAGLDQWRDKPEEWEQGMKGYGKRFASSFGRNAIQQTVTYGLDEAFDLDTGFQRSSREGVFPRVKHAFLETITSRTKTGKRALRAATRVFTPAPSSRPRRGIPSGTVIRTGCESAPAH